MGGGGWGIGSGSIIVRHWFCRRSSSFIVCLSVHRIIHPASRGSQQWGRVVWAVYSVPFGVEVSLA
jgi:hypothetical protein